MIATWTVEEILKIQLVNKIITTLASTSKDTKSTIR